MSATTTNVGFTRDVGHAVTGAVQAFVTNLYEVSN